MIDKFLQPTEAIVIESRTTGPKTLLDDETLAAGRERIAAGEDPDVVAADLAQLEIDLINAWSGDDDADPEGGLTIAAWNEEDHPRDDKGRFGPGEGTERWDKGVTQHGRVLNGVTLVHNSSPDFSQSINLEISEPSFPALPPKKSASAGVVMIEPDGRVWVYEPEGRFSGYRSTFSKGHIEPGEHPQVTAAREAWEETGLVPRITGHLMDVERTTTITRFYLGERIGGAPWAMGPEAHAVKLLDIHGTAIESALKNTHGGKTTDHTVLQTIRARVGRKASARSESALHAAADKHIPALSVALRYAFAMARKALRAPLRAKETAGVADRATDALRRALEAVLRPTLLRVVAAGGEVAVKQLVELKTAALYKLASTQVNLSGEIAAQLAAIPIDDVDLVRRETESHITVKYGLLDDDPEPIRKALMSQPPIELTFGETAYFAGVEDGTADAVYVSVESPGLAVLNGVITEAVKCKASDYIYAPHATVAYVKPGTGVKYAGHAALAGQTVTVNSLVVSNKDGSETEIRFGDMKAGAREQIRGLAAPTLKMRFDASNENAAKWAKKHAAELIDDITETSRKRIRLAIEELQEEGDWELAMDRILAAVGDQDRADLIARHESMLAASEGQRQGWDQAVEEGLLTGNERRVWIVTGDDKVCPICDELDGTLADLDGEYPGGYDGPPAHVQCRCTEGIDG